MRCDRPQLMTPRVACSFARKMFSVIDRCGIRASSWWMMTMPFCSLSRMPWKRHSSPLKKNSPSYDAVGVHARDDLHQRGLAGAVLADQGMDLARADREADVLERLDARELLRDAAHLEQNVTHLDRRLPLAVRGWITSAGVPGGDRCTPAMVEAYSSLRRRRRPRCSTRCRRAPSGRCPWSRSRPAGDTRGRS